MFLCDFGFQNRRLEILIEKYGGRGKGWPLDNGSYCTIFQITNKNVNFFGFLKGLCLIGLFCKDFNL